METADKLTQDGNFSFLRVDSKEGRQARQCNMEGRATRKAMEHGRNGNNEGNETRDLTARKGSKEGNDTR